MQANQVSQSGEHIARVHDLSTSGAFLTHIHESVFIEGDVMLELHLPGVEGALWISGQVVRNQVIDGMPGVAIEFTNISQYDQQVIDEYVSLNRGT
jgi:hypothetical protein